MSSNTIKLMLKKVLIIASTILLFSACSSKDEFYKGTYNWLQDENFCTNQKECDYKRHHTHDEYTQDKKMSYEEYKKMLKEKRD